MDLLSMAERQAATDRSAITFNASRCLHTAIKFSNCEACFQLCPVEAIHPGKPPALDEEACQRCLACLPACPVGAYIADDAVPALLNCAALVDARAIELICELHPNGKLGMPGSAVAIRVPGCLAGLGAGAYLALIALGLERVLTRTDACPQCPWGMLRSRIEAQVGGVQRLLEPWDRSDSLACAAPEEVDGLVERPVWEVDSPPLSRRDLFRLASQRGQLAATRALSCEDSGAAARRPPRERRRVVAALDHLPARDLDRDGTSLVGLGFACISASADCTACGACARACPTGALQYHQEDDVSYKLTFCPQACIGCEICLYVCTPSAITVDHQPSFDHVFGKDEPVVLREGELVRCEICKVSMAAKPGSQLCSICEFRRENPFGAVSYPLDSMEQIRKTRIETSPSFKEDK